MAPKPNEPLLLYVAATTQVVSAMLVAKREEDLGTEESFPIAGGCLTQPAKEQPDSESLGIPTKKLLVQRPVYFVSAMLRDAWEHYPKI